MSVAVKLPRLLNADLTEKARLRPTLLSIDEPLHDVGTAQMTLTERDPDVALHDWMELYTADGSAGIWRVTSMAWTVRRERVLTLRHAIDTLSDSVWHEQLDYDGTMPDFLSKLLAQQTTEMWRLGQVDDTSDYKKSGINYDRLSDLLSAAAEDKPGYAYEYDFTTSPWTVSYKALPGDVAAECRLGRNVGSCRITYDDSEMCNKLYMTWSVTTTSSSGKAISKTIRTYEDAASQAVYGIIEKTADVEEADEPHPDDWAARFLAERSAPRALIEIDGQSLEKLTGLTWDRLARGKKIQVALADYGVTLYERCEKVTHPDALGDPLRVTVELNNTLKKFSTSLADLKKQADRTSGISGGAAEQAEVNAENIASHGSSISSLGSRMGAAESNIQTLQADVIYITGTELVSIKSRLVDVEADIVQITGTDLVQINAAIVEINGDITDINSRLTSLNTTLATSIVTAWLSASNAQVLGLLDVGTLMVGGDGFSVRSIIMSGITVGSSVWGPGSGSIDLSHSHGISMTESGGNIVAEIGGAQSANGTASFSIAATSKYQTDVAAARSGVEVDSFAWTIGTDSVTVTATLDNLNSDSDSIMFTTNTTSWSNGEIDVRFLTNGTLVSSHTVSMPSSADSYSVTVDGPSGSHGTVRFSITVGGKTYSVSGVSWSS